MDSDAPATTDAKEVKIPALLLALGVAGILGWGFVHGGKAGVAVTLLVLTIQTVVGVTVLLLGCFVAAKVLGITFGFIQTAILKLTAIYVFPLAIAVWIPLPIVDGLVSAGIYFCLVTWLFDLEGKEPLWVVLIFFVVRVVVGVVLQAVLVVVQ